jgi:thiol-disulfide isomerase/thioredoxin
VSYLRKSFPPSAVLLALLCAAPFAPAAELKLVDEAGYAKLVASMKGQVVLVNFWATYCVPCRKEMPQLVALEARLRARGFRFVAISADEPEQTAQARGFLDQNKVPAPSYIRRAKDDDKFVALVDPKWNGALPASFLYDRQGRKVRAFFGQLDAKALSAAIEKLL